MKKLMQKFKEKTWLHYLLIVIIGLLVSMPFIWIQLIKTDDGFIHILRLISQDLSFKNGEFPFLVTPFFMRNFGYSMVVFYPPIVTYIPYLFGILTKSFAIGNKIFASLTIVLSGIFMYNFVNEVTKNKGMSFLAAIIYMVAPYHLEVLFNRYAMGEFSAYLFVPLVFQGLYNLLHGDKKKHFYITIGAVGIILTHLITTVYVALFCLIYCIFNFKSFFKKEVIQKCILNVVFILLICAFFVIPLLEFKSQALYNIWVPGQMGTSGNFVQSRAINISQYIRDIEIENGVSFVIRCSNFNYVMY